MTGGLGNVSDLPRRPTSGEDDFTTNLRFRSSARTVCSISIHSMQQGPIQVRYNHPHVIRSA